MDFVFTITTQNSHIVANEIREIIRILADDIDDPTDATGVEKSWRKNIHPSGGSVVGVSVHDDILYSVNGANATDYEVHATNAADGSKIWNR